MQCKSLWIKASAKCINVNVNLTSVLEIKKAYRSSKCIQQFSVIAFFRNISNSRAGLSPKSEPVQGGGGGGWVL